MSPRSVVIVGAGPAGCYAAQAIKKELPSAQITVLDRLPVPFGLLRYGVAADHQRTKAVQQQFERMFERSDAEFIGGFELGRDIDLDHLTEMFNVVVLATGVAEDRHLGVDGEARAGAIGAGQLTRALNSHPEELADLPVVSPCVAIIGSGNVAVDLLRLLSKDADEWNGSDMDEAVLKRIIPTRVSEIHLVSRSSAADARWSAAMLRELGMLRRPVFRVSTGKIEPLTSSSAEHLSHLLIAREGQTDLVINLHMECVVERVLGQERVEGVRIRERTGKSKDIAVGTVVTAIGFEPRPHGVVPPRVYLSGWLKTGPQGTIPMQRTLAKQLACEIAMDLREATIVPARPGRTALPVRHTTDFAGWRRIDAFERAHASPLRVRRKITDIEHMYAVAEKPFETTPIEKEPAN